MEAVKVCSLGQITHALYEVGGNIGGICDLLFSRFVLNLSPQTLKLKSKSHEPES
jgi:hypothetical protein